ncbi:MAG: alpha/beta fold hydrolase [Streptosporangiaceae bacterium]
MRSHDLVLLHGQPGLGSEWDQVTAGLPGRFRVLAPDRPGHGSSAQPGGGLDVNAAAVLAQMDARGIDRAVLAGHSYGGGVALRVAAIAPGRVEALVLLASVGPDCLNGWDWLLAAPLAGPFLSRMGWQLTPWFARAMMRLFAIRPGREAAIRRHVNTYVWGCTGWRNGPLWRTFLTEQRALMVEAAGLAGAARSVRVPALVVSDTSDPMVPFRTAQALVGLIPDARLHVIEGAGHHLPLRAPEEVAAQVTAFLDDIDARCGESEQASASDGVPS